MNNPLPIYTVYCTTSFGLGAQPVKAKTKRDAIRKFKKRFPKQRVIDCHKSTHTHIIQPI